MSWPKECNESFILGSIGSILSSIAWGERTLGKFIGVIPLDHGVQIRTDDFLGIKIRITYISQSLKSGGKAFRARMELKKLLPRKLCSLISAARKYSRHRLPGHHPANPGGPKPYKTKYEYFISGDFVDQDRLNILKTYVSLRDFWQCATGKVHPSDIKNYVTHQQELFRHDEL